MGENVVVVPGSSTCPRASILHGFRRSIGPLASKWYGRMRMTFCWSSSTSTQQILEPMPVAQKPTPL